MPKLAHAAFLLAVPLMLLGGCCRDTIREMGSLKDVSVRPQHRSAQAPDSEGSSSKSARIEKDEVDDGDDARPIETGSVAPATEPCQGAHLAYQATREYLKNFGPKPPDLPGEKGACKGAQ